MTDEIRRAKMREYRKKWVLENPEKHRESSRRSVERRREKIRETARMKYAADPEAVRRKKRDWYHRNPGQRRLVARKYYATNPGNQRAATLKYQYGVTREAFAAMLIAQSGRCASCGEAFHKTPHVDHNHVTGTVRGLLCSPCNTGIGHFRDSTDRLRMAIVYLEST